MSALLEISSGAAARLRDSSRFTQIAGTNERRAPGAGVGTGRRSRSAQMRRTSSRYARQSVHDAIWRSTSTSTAMGRTVRPCSVASTIDARERRLAPKRPRVSQNSKHRFLKPDPRRRRRDASGDDKAHRRVRDGARRSHRVARRHLRARLPSVLRRCGPSRASFALSSTLDAGGGGVCYNDVRR